MLPYYLVQFLQRKLFEFKQQVERRKKGRNKKDCLPNQQNLRKRGSAHADQKKESKGIYIPEKVSDMIK